MGRKIILIGGLDPTGHAGVLADARTLEDMGLPYFTVVTALTAQTDKRFFGWESCSLKIFRQQLKACGKNIWGVKIGMVGDTRLIAPLVQWLDRVKPHHVLWDPVFQSSSGGRLISAKKWNGELGKLLARTTLFTPNIPEAEWILGRSITNIIDMESAIIDLHDHLPVVSSSLAPPHGGVRGVLRPLPRSRQAKDQKSHWVLLKGGHLPPKQKQIVDLLSDGKKIYRFSAKRRKKNPRGTGCTLGSALLANLATGCSVPDAVEAARCLLFSKKF
jgi:hydroxymethylpyrimidine/phosphomethylpyrimidine kinase